MEIFTFISENWFTGLIILTSFVGSASIVAAVVAPLTTTKKDDKAASWLKKVHGWLLKMSLNIKGK